MRVNQHVRHLVKTRVLKVFCENIVVEGHVGVPITSTLKLLLRSWFKDGSMFKVLLSVVEIEKVARQESLNLSRRDPSTVTSTVSYLSVRPSQTT